jgi:replicative DNA helicase
MLGGSTGEVDPITEWTTEATVMEAALVGGIFAHPHAIGAALATEISGDHFLDETLGALWERSRATALRGDIVDFRMIIQGSVGTVFGKGTTFDQAQARLMSIAIVPALFGQYCRIIKANWALRRMLAQADFIRSSVTGVEPMQIVERVLSEIDEVRDVSLDRKGATRGSLATIAATLAASARAMFSGVGSRPAGTGLASLDKHLPMRGLAPGALLILGGRTGMGKTMLASSIANKVCQAGHGVAVFSLEVPASEIAARIVAERIGGKSPSYGDILAGHVTEGDLDQIDWERERFDELPLYLDDTPALSMADMMVACRREAARFERRGKQLRLIIIDHAQIVKASSRYAGNRVNELGEVANAAKVMAKQLGCSVLLGCQVSRASEGRDDKRPTLADLRASGEIEEAADAVLILYREAYYLAKSTEYAERDTSTLLEFDRVKNLVEVGVEKSRQGSTGRVTLWCDPARSIVTDLAGWRP